MSDEHLANLAKMVASLSGDATIQAAQVAVLVCAVGALVQSHPDAPAFAAALRRCWLQFGAPNQDAPIGSPEQAGIVSVLSILEQMCPAPLGIRPPDVAELPGGLG